MQKVNIPTTIDPVRAAQKRLSYDGIVPVQELSRLSELFVEADGDIKVKVNCNIDEQGLVVISGEASYSGNVLCQRCNEKMKQDLATNFFYTPLTQRTEEEQIPEEYETFALDDAGEMMLRQVIEDELIIALPIVPMHDPESCAYQGTMSWGKLPEAAEKPNPFDVLKELKRK
ncbi:23S rRNA accumulation protein YceD [Flocculibacter collagenilyticus]|uniref:23S rRNA accumulation protein YceD n=1 Tax=Flocculibacter collagenilyticus TaxID=2744479 RepID=UPI0018F4A5E0|nr:23S rRNA accumulation protein YceD [Flocculibacter collagenilyticus]